MSCFYFRSTALAEMRLDFLSSMGASTAASYDLSSKPSAHTTPLVRFNSGRPFIASNADPAYHAFAGAHREILEDDVPVVANISLSGSVLAVQGAGGWKNRYPTLHLYEVSAGHTFDASISVGVGLSGVAYDLQLNSARKLVYVADSDRVKSYS